MIKVANLQKSYGDFQALRGISFEVPRGQIVGFLGPNGAGKTTTMKILTCFMSPTAGSVTVDGHDVYDNPVEVRKKIGYLPESTPLYSDMIVYDYLQYVAEMREIPKSRRHDRIATITRQCGATKFIGQEIGTLSKGQKQRVGLAQAMIHEPQILILDEPTSGLDPNQIVEIRTLIKEVGKNHTIILSTHNLPEVLQTCDRLLIIHQGNIVADGTPAELEASAAREARVLLQVAQPENSPMDQDAARHRLSRITHVHSVAVAPGAGKSIRFEIQSDIGTDVRPDIFNLAVDEGWTVVELRRDSLDLEGIFRKLTQAV
ncbi:MAG: ATP-binding cassette domain-containing protein [Myxococcales bacterium]|nr:ATP-binding cassette domain-containing protein [Myxococcales bacterium]